MLSPLVLSALSACTPAAQVVIEPAASFAEVSEEAPDTGGRDTGGGERSDVFAVAPVGCSQAHCDAALSDQVGLPAPGEGATILHRDAEAPGSNYALGCSSNGAEVACAYGGVVDTGPYLVVYDAEGERLWDSDELGLSTFTSAPAIGADGGVIAADGEQVIRFRPGGDEVMWRYPLPDGAGLPISPVITARGVAVFATTSGLIGSIDTETGDGQAMLLDDPVVDTDGDVVAGAWVTRNTPSARAMASGDRIYVTTAFSPERSWGHCIGAPARLYAIDVGEDGALSEAWSLDVGGRAGASPTVSGDMIFFDADRLDAFGPGTGCDGEDAPHFFAVRDLGDTGAFVYKHPLTAPDLAPSGTGGGVASAALDPDGGLWLFALGSSVLVRLSEEPSAEHTTTDGSPTAAVLQALDVGTVLPGAQPSSAITIAEGAVGMMTFAEVSAGGGGLIDTRWVSIDLGRDDSEVDLINDIPLGEGLSGWSAAQSPVALDEDGQPRVFLSTFSEGLVVIGEE